MPCYTPTVHQQSLKKYSMQSNSIRKCDVTEEEKGNARYPASASVYQPEPLHLMNLNEVCWPLQEKNKPKSASETFRLTPATSSLPLVGCCDTPLAFLRRFFQTLRNSSLTNETKHDHEFYLLLRCMLMTAKICHCLSSESGKQRKVLQP